MYAIASTIASWLNTPIIQLASGGITLWAVLYLVLVSWFIIWLTGVGRNWLIKRFMAEGPIPPGVQRLAGSVFRALAIIFGIYGVLITAGVVLSLMAPTGASLGIDFGPGVADIGDSLRRHPVSDRIEAYSLSLLVTVLGDLKRFLSAPIIVLEKGPITLSTLLYIMGAIIALFWFTGRLNDWITKKLLDESRIPMGTRQALGTIARYFLIVVGFLLILDSAGIDLTTLNVIAGAVGIGVGFGLQTIANNFLSGLVILFERPIKLGDRIEIEGVDGIIVAINGRSTTVLTDDNISIIVPNSTFISHNVVNWTHVDRLVRFRMPVRTAFRHDADLVKQALLDAAAQCPIVLTTPSPDVWFRRFGENGLEFELGCWADLSVTTPRFFVSEVNFSIWKSLQAAGIEVPLPQRDIRVKSDVPVSMKPEKTKRRPVIEKIPEPEA